MRKIDEKGAEMTHNEFVEYIKAKNEWFESTSDRLLDLEKGGGALCPLFCDIYKLLLEQRLSFSIVCSEYYRSMAEKSFWFMKGRVLKRAKMFESLHKMTLQELITLRIYMKLQNF